MSAAITVLNVDDQEIPRYTLTRNLRVRGFSVTEAKNGEEALRLIKAERPRIVLLDVNLPDISGFEVCRRIKSDPETSDIPVLHISATFSDAEAKVRGLDSGADGYLTGGESPELVVATIRALLRARTAEQTLREQETRFRFHLEAAQIGTWDWDMLVNRVEWSHNIEAIHGQPPGRFRNTFEGFLESVHPEDRDAVMQRIQRAVASGGDYRIEYREVRADGRIGWMEVKGRVFFDRSGTPVRMSGVCMDVSERRRLEERLHSAAKLESLGVLAGGIAHDFNNLLVGVIGNASLALEILPPSNPARPLLDGVMRAGERAAQLTQQMLAYSGRGRFFLEPVDLSALVRNVSGIVCGSVPENVTLRLELAEDLPPVEADAPQLQQAVMNLLLNAAEAFAETAGSITVTTEVREIAAPPAAPSGEAPPPGTYVVLEVQDTGSGMDEATQGRIFDPFFTTKFMGRGLGLPAVLGIARGHKGTLSVESAPGRGSTFTLFLPARAGS